MTMRKQAVTHTPHPAHTPLNALPTQQAWAFMPLILSSSASIKTLQYILTIRGMFNIVVVTHILHVSSVVCVLMLVLLQHPRFTAISSMYPAWTVPNLQWHFDIFLLFLFLYRIFGFVARKQGSANENTCHIFAELDPEQPASAIVNFVTKVMIGQSKVKT